MWHVESSVTSVAEYFGGRFDWFKEVFVSCDHQVSVVLQ